MSSDNGYNGSGPNHSSGFGPLDGLTSGNGHTNGANPAKPAGESASPPTPPKQLGNPGLYGRLRSGSVNTDPRTEVLESVRERVHRRVISELGPVFYTNAVEQRELRSRVERIVQAALRTEKTPMSAAEIQQVAQSVADDVLGYGPIERLL
ncbi:MAG TPA: hypothetical protein VEJ84_24360, partial [Acidimicrobiales bacterium]|nr:hypothetical protein [Acidimicrobiales bacterium]